MFIRRPLFISPFPLGRRHYLAFTSGKGDPTDSVQDSLAYQEYSSRKKSIYRDFHGLTPGSPAYQEKGRKAEAFLANTTIFRLDQANDYAQRLSPTTRNYLNTPSPISLRKNFLKQVELIHQSSSIEGLRQPLGHSLQVCSFSLLPSFSLLSSVEDSKEKEEKGEIRNHFLALRYGLDLPSPLTPSHIHDLHHLLFQDCPPMNIWGKVVNYGEYRHLPSRPSGYPTVYAFPLEIPYLMEKWCSFYSFSPLSHERMENRQKERSTQFFHLAKGFLDLLQIHPYFDGNGRIARMVFAILLKQMQFPPLIFYQKSGITRRDYIDSIAAAHGGVETPFYRLLEKNLST